MATRIHEYLRHVQAKDRDVVVLRSEVADGTGIDADTVSRLVHGGGGGGITLKAAKKSSLQ